MQQLSDPVHRSSVGKIPVLLTSSVVAHDNRVALTDTAVRIDLTLESVAQWLQLDPHLQLVICDGSNFDFSLAVAQRFPAASIECLCFENDQAAVRRKGRGFGEGEIVRFAVSRSRMIQHAGAFAKCTSKLWVSNYAECLVDWNGNFLCKAVFDHVFSPFKKTTLSYIDTRFYVVSLPYYKQYFEAAHQSIDLGSGKGLEDCFLEIFTSRCIDRVLFNTPPVIDGVGGGIGKYYKNPWKRRIKEKLRLHLVRTEPRFRTLFALKR